MLFPVVIRFTNIGLLGYSTGKNTSHRKQPFAYGVSAGPVISTCCVYVHTIILKYNHFKGTDFHHVQLLFITSDENTGAWRQWQGGTKGGYLLCKPPGLCRTHLGRGGCHHSITIVIRYMKDILPIFILCYYAASVYKKFKGNKVLKNDPKSHVYCLQIKLYEKNLRIEHRASCMQSKCST